MIKQRVCHVFERCGFVAPRARRRRGRANNRKKIGAFLLSDAAGADDRGDNAKSPPDKLKRPGG
jgi:hypothetical protein